MKKIKQALFEITFKAIIIAATYAVLHFTLVPLVFALFKWDMTTGIGYYIFLFIIFFLVEIIYPKLKR